MHPFRDFVPATLEHHSAGFGEVDADVCAVELLFGDQRGVSNERFRFFSSEMLIVIGALGAEKMRRAGIFDEIVAGGTHIFVKF